MPKISGWSKVQDDRKDTIWKNDWSGATVRLSKPGKHSNIGSPWHLSVPGGGEMTFDKRENARKKAVQYMRENST